jgi:hypothetical protein
LRSSPPHALTGRGLKIAQNAELRQKFNDHKTGFPVGTLLTFAAFTSVSLDDKVANGFGDHVLFNFTRVRGVRIRALSAVPQEAEVLVPPPSVFKILTVAMFHGSLVVTLEQVDSPLTYLSLPSPPASLPPSSPAVVASVSASFPAVASGGAAAVGDDDELQQLVFEMVQLKVGLKKACITFARSLALAGVMSLEELRAYPSAKARGFLEKSGMREVQVDKVIAAYNPPPAAPASNPLAQAAIPPPFAKTAAPASNPVSQAALPSAVCPPVVGTKFVQQVSAPPMCPLSPGPPITPPSFACFALVTIGIQY